MPQKSFPVALQLELMAVLWGILAVLLTLTKFITKYQYLEYGALLCAILCIIYFFGSIIRSKKRKLS